MASYKQFSQEERIMLSALKGRGLTQEEIGRELGKNQSSISRELRRNGKEDGKYHAGDARRKVRERKEKVNGVLRRIENDMWLEAYVTKKIKKYWSPEQIAGRVRKEHGKTVCHETIYQYIYREHPELKEYLRCRKGKYRRRYRTKKREKQREEGKKRRIDKRPEIIEKRERVGDWEGDTVVGKRGTGSLITNIERKSGYAIDNGSEFEAYEMIEGETEMEIYFAYPYHSWERGTNENTNGLIRQFFPKKTAFTDINVRNTRRVERLLNTRPRKRLGYLTPVEVFSKNMHLH